MTRDQNAKKQAVAKAAIEYVEADSIVGVGTGSTVNFFIEELGKIKHKIEGAVSSSEASTERLKALGIEVFELNEVSNLSVYIDGADEVTEHKHMIKGGGAALTREKIVAGAATTFVCIVDESKRVPVLGSFPLPVEVIPMARSFVARELVKLGGDPEYRQGVVTDNGNVILDVHNLEILNPRELEQKINNYLGSEENVEKIKILEDKSRSFADYLKKINDSIKKIRDLKDNANNSNMQVTKTLDLLVGRKQKLSKEINSAIEILSKANSEVTRYDAQKELANKLMDDISYDKIEELQNIGEIKGVIGRLDKLIQYNTICFFN